MGRRVNWVSGSHGSWVTGSLGHKMWPSSMSVKYLSLCSACLTVFGGCYNLKALAYEGICNELSKHGRNPRVRLVHLNTFLCSQIWLRIFVPIVQKYIILYIYYSNHSKKKHGDLHKNRTCSFAAIGPSTWNWPKNTVSPLMQWCASDISLCIQSINQSINQAINQSITDAIVAYPGAPASR